MAERIGRFKNRTLKRMDTLAQYKNPTLKWTDTITWYKNRTLKWTDTITRYKNRTLKCTDTIARYKNWTLKQTDTIARYKSRKLKSTDCVGRYNQKIELVSEDQTIGPFAHLCRRLWWLFHVSVPFNDKISPQICGGRIQIRNNIYGSISNPAQQRITDTQMQLYCP